MFHKVVSSLPDPLDNDSVYFVRAGSGFDVYVTNHNGGVINAYALNYPEVDDKSYTAAENVRIHHVVVGQSDGKAIELDINNEGHGLKILGIAKQSASTDGSFTVQSSGYMTEAGWSWTPGEPIYAGAEGLLTQAVPAGAFIVIVALALSATELNVFLHSPIYL